MANEIQDLIAAAADVGSKATALGSLHAATVAAQATQSTNASAAATQATADAKAVSDAQAAEQQGDLDLVAAEGTFQTAAAAVTALYPGVTPVSPTAAPPSTP